MSGVKTHIFSVLMKTDKGNENDGILSVFYPFYIIFLSVSYPFPFLLRSHPFSFSFLSSCDQILFLSFFLLFLSSCDPFFFLSFSRFSALNNVILSSFTSKYCRPNRFTKGLEGMLHSFQQPFFQGRCTRKDGVLNKQNINCLSKEIVLWDHWENLRA